jgi:uncharacterized protein HemY
MTKADVLALPAALNGFNGFYTVSGQFVMENSIRLLIVFAVIALLVIVAIVWLLVRYLRRRHRRQEVKLSC